MDPQFPVDPQSIVTCFQEASCRSSEGFTITTRADCCNNRILPLGAAFTLSGIEGCFPCPVGELYIPIEPVSHYFIITKCSRGKGAFNEFSFTIYKATQAFWLKEPTLGVASWDDYPVISYWHNLYTCSCRVWIFPEQLQCSRTRRAIYFGVWLFLRSGQWYYRYSLPTDFRNSW